MPKSVFTWDHIRQIEEHPHLLGILAGKKLLNETHSEWMRFIHNSGTEDRGLMASRGSYKTTSVIEIGSIYRLMKNPHQTIALVRKTYTLASDIVKTIMNIMETPIIKELLTFVWFADANGNIPTKAEWHFNIRKEGKINLSIRNTHTPECTIEALGLDGNITGKHYDTILLDDCVSYSDRLYTAEREYTKMMIAEIRSNIVNRDGVCCSTGTVWHREDAWSMLEASGMPIQRYPYTVLPFISEEHIEEARKSQSAPLFACNYALEFTNTEDQLFVDPYMGPWERRDVKEVVAHLDAAYGGDDYCALTIAGRLPNGKLNAVGWVEKVHVKDWIPFVFQKMSQYGAHKIFMETNSDKGLILDMMAAHPLAQTYSIWTEPYAESMNKQLKIASVLFEKWNDIQFAHETDPKYLLQITDWSENVKAGEHDDCPDSLSSLLYQAGFSSAGGNWMSLYK